MLSAVIGIIMWICMILLISGRVSFFVNGFAVDADGQLYVGKGNKIIVFKDDVCIRKIEPPTSRTYKFTIADGQYITLTTSTEIYTMDLFGNIISKQPDEENKLYSELQWKKTYTDQKGFHYTLKSVWGRQAIYREGVQIYIMPTFDYVVLILFITVLITVFITGIITVKRQVTQGK